VQRLPPKLIQGPLSLAVVRLASDVCPAWAVRTRISFAWVDGKAAAARKRSESEDMFEGADCSARRMGSYIV
jgi:hypothetical protein